MSQARTAMTSRSVDDLARTLAPQRSSTAPPSSMDSLARSLAMPMPRRRALRLLGSALVLAAVPALRPSRTWAAAGGIEDRPDIIDPPEGPFGPPVRCGDVVCNPTFNCVKCCPAEGGGGSCCPCYHQLPPPQRPLRQAVRMPAGRPPVLRAAGTLLRAERSTCCRGSICLPICKPDEQLCDDDCCPKRARVRDLAAPRQPAPS